MAEGVLRLGELIASSGAKGGGGDPKADWSKSAKERADSRHRWLEACARIGADGRVNRLTAIAAQSG